MRDELKLIRDEDGTPVEIMGFRIDITNRKQAEEALRRAKDELERQVEERTLELLRANEQLIWNEALLSRMANSSPLAYFAVDNRTDDILYFNNRFCEIWGIERLADQMRHKMLKNRDIFLESVPLVANPESFVATCKRIRSEEERSVIEDEIEFNDGRTIRRFSTQLSDEQDKHFGRFYIFEDITDRREAERAERQRKAYLRAIIENQPGLVWLKDEDSRFLAVNYEFARSCGRETPEDVVGKTDLDVWPKELAEKYRHDDKKVMETGRPLMVEEPIFDKGETKWFETFKTPVRVADKRIIGTTGCARDITDRKKAEERLLQAERFRAVADLAGGVAHNFNNLLQIVIGNLELALMDLEMGNYTDIKDSLEKVLESSKFGAETVRRLQSFAGIRDHSQVPQRGVFDLSGIVRQAVEMSKTWWKTIPEKQGRKVSLDIHLQEGCLVQCEKNELFEVVVNLIKNATEALTQDGAIDVETRVEGDRGILKVRDTGVGISEQNLKRLFNPFFTTKASAGSGLGLASSRKIIEDCGGNILADSSEGKGTTFTVVLPLVKEEPKLPRTEKTPDTGQQLTVLAIDDEEAMLDLLKNALSRHNCEVFTALSGEKGLDIFKENPVDLVICDLGMPGMTGWEVGKRIRTICEERGIKKTPFMLLTGWGEQKTEVEKMSESGVDVVMEKPLNIKNMVEVVREVAEKSRSRDFEE